jgi:hypothetical protein
MARMRMRRVLTPAAVALTAILGVASPAAAAVDDSFDAYTYPLDDVTSGVVHFVDYGPGAPGGGDNDDYLVLEDLAPDGHGVQVWAWLQGKYLGTKYNGNGAGSEVIYDPYSIFPNNVAAGEVISVKICAVDGPGNIIDEYTCGTGRRVSADG